MPREYGSYVTAWRRLKRWQEEGVWTGIWQAFLASLNEQGKLIVVTCILGRQLRPGEKGEEEIGPAKVGKGTKRMLVVDGNGIPLALLIARASRAEVKLAEATLDRVRVPRRRGRPRKRPERLVADKAYDCDRLRSWLRRKGIIPCIPP